MHQPHFSSSPCTNLNSTHSPKPSSGRPAKPSLPSSSEIRTEIAPQDRTEIAPITLRLHRSHWDRTNHTLGLHWDDTHCTDRIEITPQDHIEIAPISLFPNLVLPSSIDTDLSLTLSSFFSQFDRIWWIVFCWVLFLCLSIEKWYYIFVWKLRKCEEQVENVFSILFSATQPNTRKYFPKHFLECNQILENTLHLENILHSTKRSLSYMLFPPKKKKKKNLSYLHAHFFL